MPNVVEVFSLAVQYHQAGDFGQAEQLIAQYRQALNLDPNYLKAHNNLGIPLMDQRRLNEAAASCAGVAARSPTMPKRITTGGLFSAFRTGGTKRPSAIKHCDADRIMQTHMPTSAISAFSRTTSTKLGPRMSKRCVWTRAISRRISIEPCSGCGWEIGPRSWYREALVRLTALPQVVKAAVQTNLSCGLGWVKRCDKRKLGLWTTYHPAESDRARFLAKCHQLSRLGVRYSVGVVGLREHFGDIAALRRELPPDVYLWINAFKDKPSYYRDGESEWLASVDPLFPFNNRRHASLGRQCRAGDTVITVDGEGTVRRCHFVKEPLGNLYDADFERVLTKRSCPNATCGCHIGYVHMPELHLYEVFGDGVLERSPNSFDASEGLSTTA